jgi:hypothetical protein
MPHDLVPEVPHNGGGVIRPGYVVIMMITWVVFAVLGCLNVPMLVLWMVLGVFTVRGGLPVWGTRTANTSRPLEYHLPHP